MEYNMIISMETLFLGNRFMLVEDEEERWQIWNVSWSKLESGETKSDMASSMHEIDDYFVS